MTKFFAFQNERFKIKHPCWFYAGHRCYPTETDIDCKKCCDNWWKEKKKNANR